MIKVLGLAGLLALASGLALADSVVLGGNSWTNTPTNISMGIGCGMTTNCGALGMGPYWDDISGDGMGMNVGNFLTGTCGIPADCTTNYGPLQYVSQSNGSGNPNAPTGLTLQNTYPSDSVTMLANFTGDTTLTFGYYNVASPGTLFPLFGPGSLTADKGTAIFLNSLSSGGVYGFYLSRSCQGETILPISNCVGGYTTWYSNDSLDNTDVGHQHFSIFDSSTAGIYYIGVEDWINNSGEGYGDYNDIIFELNSSSSSVETPEPATLGLIGAGLLGLGVARFRSRKKKV